MLDEKAIFATTNQVATLSLRTYGTAVYLFDKIFRTVDIFSFDIREH